jgi:hypothetical protein
MGYVLRVLVALAFIAVLATVAQLPGKPVAAQQLCVDSVTRCIYVALVLGGTQGDVFPTNTPTATSTSTATATTPPTITSNVPTFPPFLSPTPTTSTGPACDPSYPDFCIPPPPPDLNCTSPLIANRKDFTVLPPDPHRFDTDNDGVGCESRN